MPGAEFVSLAEPNEAVFGNAKFADCAGSRTSCGNLPEVRGVVATLLVKPAGRLLTWADCVVSHDVFDDPLGIGAR